MASRMKHKRRSRVTNGRKEANRRYGFYIIGSKNNKNVANAPVQG